jgi:low density lipoprotein-related protein 2
VILQGRGATVSKPVALEVFESNMYWVNADSGSVLQQDKFGRGVPVTLADNLPNPKAVRVVHPLRYNTSVSNPCFADQCSHLCVLVPGGGFRCLCPNGNGGSGRCDAGQHCRNAVLETLYIY